MDIFNYYVKYINLPRKRLSSREISGAKLPPERACPERKILTFALIRAEIISANCSLFVQQFRRAFKTRTCAELFRGTNRLIHWAERQSPVFKRKRSKKNYKPVRRQQSSLLGLEFARMSA